MVEGKELGLQLTDLDREWFYVLLKFVSGVLKRGKG